MRKELSVPFQIKMLICITSRFIPPINFPSGYTTLVTVLAMMGRFFITFAMNTGAQISFEVVPTELRGQGNALANVMAQGTQFFSPYIVYSVS